MEAHAQIPSKRKLPVGTAHSNAHSGSTTAFLPRPHSSRDTHRKHLNILGSSCPTQDSSPMSRKCPGAPLTGQPPQLHWSQEFFLLNPPSSCLFFQKYQNSIALCRSPCLLLFLLPFFFTGVFSQKSLAYQFLSWLWILRGPELTQSGCGLMLFWLTLHFPLLPTSLLEMQSPQKPSHLIVEPFFNP